MNVFKKYFNSPLKGIMLGFFLWRALLFIFAVISGKLLVFQPRFPYSEIYLTTSGLPAWFWSFANFDGVHYLGIASMGYWAQYSQVFFPLFPIILRFGSFFGRIQPVFTGIVIANIFFLFSLFVLYKLLVLDINKKMIVWVFLFILLYPTSFFFGSLYTESLFFLLLVSSFYFARKKKWFLASVCAGLASFTRLVGIFLLPALLLEWYLPNKKNILSFLRCPAVYIVPLGLVAYMFYLHITFGDPLYFWHAQPVFGANRSGSSIILLPQVLYRYLKIFLTLPFYSESFWIPFIEFLLTMNSLFLLLMGHVRKIRLSYLVFGWLALIVPTLTGTFSSMPRYTLILFPQFMVLGHIHSVRIKSAVILLSAVLLGILTVLFTAGHWVS